MSLAPDIITALSVRREEVRQCLADLAPSDITAYGKSDKPSIEGSAEDVLRLVMVNDRAKVERRQPVDRDRLYDRLRFIALEARQKDDLRFIDALNYFFEIDAGFRKNGNLLSLYSSVLTELVADR